MGEAIGEVLPEGEIELAAGLLQADEGIAASAAEVPAGAAADLFLLWWAESNPGSGLDSKLLRRMPRRSRTAGGASSRPYDFPDGCEV